MEWFEENEVNVMKWPAQSPDLNPIGKCPLIDFTQNSLFSMTLKLTIFSEHIWGYLKNKIHQHCPKNKEEVWHYAQIEWKKIPVALCKKLCYDNYMNRIKAVVESKGKHTKY